MFRRSTRWHAMQGLVVNLMAMPDPDAGREMVEVLAMLGGHLLPEATTTPGALVGATPTHERTGVLR